MKILFVCSSNICRSPFCEFYFRRLADNNPILKEKIEWIKSGAVLNKSRKIHPKAVSTMIKEGFSEEEIISHNPCFFWFKPKRFYEADVIIGMSKIHKYLLPFWFWKKTTTLSEIAVGQYIKIPDPFLIKSQDAYDSAMLPIKKYLDIYFGKLLKE